MNGNRPPTVGRVFVTALALLSWFVITNHCALGLMQPAGNAVSEHAHCHGKPGGCGEKAPDQGKRPCCRAIKASLSSKLALPLNTAEIEAQIDAHFIVRQTRLGAPLPILLPDHGPPRAVSFAELVLQESLLNHAPPVAA